MSETIVEFTRPPVVEVVAGVALDGLGDEAGPLLAAFWVSRLRQHFPGLQQQPPYNPPLETFSPSSQAGGIAFNIGFTPAARLWALREGGQELLQLQPEWFACNWRKVQPKDEYDRWSNRLGGFRRWYQELVEFLKANGSTEPRINQCEVTYINHIKSGVGWQSHSQFTKVFNASLGAGGPYPLEQVSAQAQFLLSDGDDPIGRLYARVVPGFDRDGRTPIYVFELTARGAPIGQGLDGAVEFLNRGRAAIDESFLALTTAEMHVEWGLVR